MLQMINKILRIILIKFTKLKTKKTLLSKIALEVRMVLIQAKFINNNNMIKIIAFKRIN